MLSALRTIGWLFSLLLATIPCYWLVVHPRAEFWRSKRGARFKILGPIWMAMWAVAGVVTYPWRRIVLYDALWPWIPAGVLFATGFYIYYRAQFTFTLAQLTGRPEVEGDKFEQELMTTGLHARIRHPVYLGHLCELIAWSMGTGEAVIYGLTVFAIITGGVMLRMEDAELERRFGERYRDYKKATPALIPRMRPGRITESSSIAT